MTIARKISPPFFFGGGGHVPLASPYPKSMSSRRLVIGVVIMSVYLELAGVCTLLHAF